MTAPVLFLMRELRRLDIIGGKFDASCFYMNSPARRVAAELGWITKQEATKFDIESILEFSRRTYERMRRDTKKLLPFFDMPLQWYALHNP
jgi:hypothetical protein